MKTGFKATYDFICRDHKFEIGKTYELPGIPIPCKYGFHYCQDPINVLEYYSIQYNFRLLEIEDLGESITQEDKTVTNKIRIIREIPKEEYYPLFGIVNNELTIHYKNGSWEKCKYDERNNIIYHEASDGYCEKRSFDERNNCIYSENSTGYHTKQTYDENNNLIYFENSNKFWEKYEYDERNNCIRFEESSGFWEKHTFDENNNLLKTESGNK